MNGVENVVGNLRKETWVFHFCLKVYLRINKPEFQSPRRAPTWVRSCCLDGFDIKCVLGAISGDEKVNGGRCIGARKRRDCEHILGCGIQKVFGDLPSGKFGEEIDSIEWRWTSDIKILAKFDLLRKIATDAIGNTIAIFINKKKLWHSSNGHCHVGFIPLIHLHNVGRQRFLEGDFTGKIFKLPRWNSDFFLQLCGYIKVVAVFGGSLNQRIHRIYFVVKWRVDAQLSTFVIKTWLTHCLSQGNLTEEQSKSQQQSKSQKDYVRSQWHSLEASSAVKDSTPISNTAIWNTTNEGKLTCDFMRFWIGRFQILKVLWIRSWLLIGKKEKSQERMLVNHFLFTSSSSSSSSIVNSVRSGSYFFSSSKKVLLTIWDLFRGWFWFSWYFQPINMANYRLNLTRSSSSSRWN